MRNIGHEWRNLAEGFLRVVVLEARFRAEWGSRLERARRKRMEAERQKARRRGRVALVAALILALVLFAVALVLLLLSSPASSVALWLAIVVPAVLILYGVWSFLPTSDADAVLEDLSDRWWRTVSGCPSSVRRSGPVLPARHYGDRGEEAFLSYLAGALPSEYVAVRGLLVARDLDADVIVLGPTGVWVYEVKHYSGEITCERGQWRRVKTYRQPGGRLARELEVLRPFDKQWVKEASTVKGALRRSFPRYQALPRAVGGGLVFTHRGLSFRVDDSCQAWVGKPESCVEVISGSPEIPGLTMEKRLQAIDALLEWSDRLHDQREEAPSEALLSSVELAERLHKDAVSRASSYLSDSGESGRAAPSPEVKEARKRAFWHPHPDDPPKT